MSGNQPSFWEMLSSSNAVAWLGGLGTTAGIWAASWSRYKAGQAETLRAKNDTSAALAKQMSADVSDAFGRQAAEITRLTADIARRDQTIADLRGDVELGWGKGRSLEAWIFAFVRHDHGNLAQLADTLYRGLGWLLEDPVDPARREMAAKMLAGRQPYVEPAVPTLAEIEGRRAP